MKKSSFEQIIHAASVINNENLLSIDELCDLLQPRFAEEVENLLDKHALITKSGTVAAFLIYYDLVRIEEAYPMAPVVILDVLVSERGAQVIQDILDGHVANGND